MIKFYPKILFLSIIFMVLPMVVFADGKDLTSLMNEIKNNQGIQNIEEVDCSKISDEQFEEAGEALMALTHPRKEEHELIEQMMGGEGSASLKAMRVLMGKKYLGCFEDGYRGGMMGWEGMTGMAPMMSGMMGWRGGSFPSETFGKWSGYSMMGGYSPWGILGILGWISVLAFWLLLILAIAALIKWLLKNK